MENGGESEEVAAPIKTEKAAAVAATPPKAAAQTNGDVSFEILLGGHSFPVKCGSKLVTSNKIVLKLSRTIRSYIVKGNHIGPVVREILRYTDR